MSHPVFKLEDKVVITYKDYDEKLRENSPFLFRHGVIKEFSKDNKVVLVDFSINGSDFIADMKKKMKVFYGSEHNKAIPDTCRWVAYESLEPLIESPSGGMVDAVVSKTTSERSAGSSPALGTKRKKKKETT